ncbi:MAG: ABC transporter permease [Candidatus Thermoplasmatota archaeon]
MSSFGNIFKKELRELLTAATFIPIILMALMFGLIGNTVNIEEEISHPPVIGLINNDDNTTFSHIASSVLYKNAKVVFSSTRIEEKETGLKNVKEKDGVALIIIPENFNITITNGEPGEITIYWIMKGAGAMDTISSSVVESLISEINLNISRELIQRNTTVNATFALTPTMKNETTYFKDREIPGLSPNTITAILSSQSFLIPIIMMMIIIMAGSLVISSMGMEKENKTLETLLTLPVNRLSIVAGKISAAALIGLFTAIIYMIGMGYYMQSFNVSDTINISNYDFVLSNIDYILIGVSLFVTMTGALSLCMLLGSFAKNYKSAQTLTFPITILALIPMFITMFKDFDTLPLALKALVFAIPFSHPMMAPRALMFNDHTLVISGIVYVSLFAIVTISIVVWLFKTDILITGATKRPRVLGLKGLRNLK